MAGRISLGRMFCLEQSTTFCRSFFPLTPSNLSELNAPSLYPKYQLIAMLFRCWTHSLCSNHFCSEATCCVCLPLCFREIPRPVCSDLSGIIHNRTSAFFPPDDCSMTCSKTSSECCFLVCWPLVLVTKILHTHVRAE